MKKFAIYLSESLKKLAGLARHVHSTRTLAMIALFTSLILSSDYALAPVFNVKLLDTLVFVSAYAFGFRIGASIAILSELIWGTLNPNGFGGLIIPFLIVGELVYVVAGYTASRIWKIDDVKLLTPRNLFLGATLAICAFLWDVETNLASGFLEGARTPVQYISFLVFGIPFAIPHELSDFIFGATLAPIIIVYFKRYSVSFRQRREVSVRVPEGGR